MGRHDAYAHFMHITKNMKFRPPKPEQSNLYQHNQPPQVPPKKSNAFNQYRGHGKGV